MDTRVLFIEFGAIHSCLGAQWLWLNSASSREADRLLQAMLVIWQIGRIIR